MVTTISIVRSAPYTKQTPTRRVVRARGTSGFGRAAALGLAALVLATSSLGSLALASNVERSVFCNGIRVQDEIVVVNVRSLCGSCDPESLASGVQLQVYQASGESGYRQWQPYDLESLLAADASVPTVIFVHGNQIAPGQDKQEGLAVYRRMVSCSSDSGPIRYVIFSWPSTKIRGPLNDVRAKAARTRPVACQFAWLLNQLSPETPLTLVGYSYGARIITGGLHILAGGTLGGLGLDQSQHSDRQPVNAVLIAAALDANWLGPNQYHGLAMSQVDHMLLLNNCQDLAMRYYHLSTKCGRPQALGLRGPTRIAPEDAAKITKRDLSRYDGPRHDLFRYLAAPGVTSQMWQLVIETEAASPTLD
jgi:hypothetical protein